MRIAHVLTNDESDFIGLTLRTAMPTLHKYTQISHMTCRCTQVEACSISAHAALTDARLERVYTSAGPPVGDQASDQP